MKRKIKIMQVLLPLLFHSSIRMFFSSWRCARWKTIQFQERTGAGSAARRTRGAGDHRVFTAFSEWDVICRADSRLGRHGEGQIGNGDGLITCERHVPLTILIADCLPVFFASRDGVAIGLAHAGWRGTHGNISGKMVRRFETEFAVPPSELLVWIGPGISRCCFQVKDDVWGPFQQDWGHLPSAFDVPRKLI